MPVGLYETYNQMMREILKQENNYPDYCKTVLLAAVNSYRPLQLHEMKKKKKNCQTTHFGNSSKDHIAMWFTFPR